MATRIDSMHRITGKALLAVLAVLFALLVAGCGQGDSVAGASDTTAAQGNLATRIGESPYTVITTTAMIADIVRNVAGDQANVRALMGPNIDPHLYRATRSDMAALLSADVVFYNGLNLEGRMGDAFVKVARAGRPVFAVTELLDEAYLLEPEGLEGHDDPHVWMDPHGWIKATEVVISKLAEFDPTNAELYRHNGSEYIAQLQELDSYARQALSTVAAERRVLVTAHDAFNYFARAYNIEVRGIQGISTDSQAGVRQIEQLIELLVTRRIPAVFTESSVSDKNVKALVEGAQARSHDVRIGGELFSDAMGDEGTYEGTYFGMIDHNITTIVRGLGGNAPARGMKGQLQGEHES